MQSAAIASDQRRPFKNSRIVQWFLFGFSLSSDLNDWNGAQRWNASMDSGQALGTHHHPALNLEPLNF
jgi:hypothetical protein